MATPAKATIMTPGRRRRRGPGRAGPGRVPGPDLHPGDAGPPRLAAPADPLLPGLAAPGVVHRRRTTGTSSPAAWTWRPAARARPSGSSPTPGSPATAAWPTCSPKPPARSPKFAAVICEDIERSGRDTFNALKLEKKLSRNGIPLFATDEPAVIDGVNATTVLVRRMKQGVAEWFRLQLKEKTWKGLVEHALDGWNIGPAPYGYLADRIPHPVPVKASQGRTKTRLALDPDRAPVVEQIFTWRTVDKLGMPTIAARLNADPARYPAPAGKGWTTQTVFAVLRQPQVHRAHGLRPDPQAQRPPRHRPGRTSGCGPPSRSTPPSWTAPPGTQAQQIGAEHGTSRDGDRAEHPPGRHPDLHLPGPDPVPGLPPPDGRPRLRPAPASTCTTSARTTPPTPGTPPPAPATPAPSKPPKPAWTRSSPCSSTSTSSAPAAPPCSPPSSPPPTPPRPRTATPGPPP